MTEINETEFTELKSKVEAIENSYWELVDRLEQRIETLEMMIAQLIPAYGEVATNVQVILEIMAKSTPEEREELQQALATARKQMIDTLSYAAKQDDNKSEQP